jgi:hypothetical protein
MLRWLELDERLTRVGQEGPVMSGKVLGVNALAKSISKTRVNPGDSERAAIREMVKSAKERGETIPY